MKAFRLGRVVLQVVGEAHWHQLYLTLITSDSDLGDNSDSKGQQREECQPEWEDESSDCESVPLGNDRVENPEPSITFGSEPGVYDGDVDEGERPDSFSDRPEDSVPPSINTVPDFDPLETPFDNHTAQPRIPHDLNRRSPLAFSTLFIPEEAFNFNTFATNTNLYAESKDANDMEKNADKKEKNMEEYKCS